MAARLLAEVLCSAPSFGHPGRARIYTAAEPYREALVRRSGGPRRGEEGREEWARGGAPHFRLRSHELAAIVAEAERLVCLPPPPSEPSLGTVAEGVGVGKDGDEGVVMGAVAAVGATAKGGGGDGGGGRRMECRARIAVKLVGCVGRRGGID